MPVWETPWVWKEAVYLPTWVPVNVTLMLQVVLSAGMSQLGVAGVMESPADGTIVLVRETVLGEVEVGRVTLIVLGAEMLTPEMFTT